MRYFLIILFALQFPGIIGSQSSQLPLNDKAYHIIDRLEISTSAHSSLHSSLKYFSRELIGEYSIALNRDTLLSSLDQEDLNYLYKENNEWILNAISKGKIDSSQYFQNKKSFLKYFYKTPANFWELDTKDFYVRVNPVLQFKIGKARNNENIIFQNTRGFDIRGGIDEKVYFYTSLFETQQRFNDYTEDRIAKFQAIPGQGLYKEYQSSILDKINGWDFLNAQGYVGFNISKHVGLEFGHGKHFIGNGYQSLLLSDYGHNYFYLKFNTNVWKFHYQNIFAELSAVGGRDTKGDVLLPKKYMAAHYLDFHIKPNFSIGLYEAVIFNRADHVEFQYLNPIILYRTVELFLDSPDNVVIGINTKWNIAKKFQLYGQVIFDEFKLDELIEGNGWWANKYGIQLGAKYINVLNIDHLDAQIEYNLSRPYLYAHRDTVPGFSDLSIGSYSHYNQALAHPLGANFNEFIMRLKYQPFSNFIMDGRFIATTFGDDEAGQNWGGNILLPLNSREMDYGNSIGQGVMTDMKLFALDISYELMHNYYLELHFLYRNKNSAIESRSRKTTYFGGGLRVNMANQRLDY